MWKLQHCISLARLTKRWRVVQRLLGNSWTSSATRCLGAVFLWAGCLQTRQRLPTAVEAAAAREQGSRVVTGAKLFSGVTSVALHLSSDLFFIVGICVSSHVSPAATPAVDERYGMHSCSNETAATPYSRPAQSGLWSSGVGERLPTPFDIRCSDGRQQYWYGGRERNCLKSAQARVNEAMLRYNLQALRRLVLKRGHHELKTKRAAEELRRRLRFGGRRLGWKRIWWRRRTSPEQEWVDEEHT